MSKPRAVLPDEPVPRSAWRRHLPWIVLGLLLSPLIREGLAILVAEWTTMAGHPMAVHTPWLVWIGAVWDSATSSMGSMARAWFRDPAWKPGPTIGLAVAWAIAAAWLLRSRRD